MDYKARFYSIALGRFTQPDTVIPELTEPQAWNRFAYVFNNPICNNDPSGHCPGCLLGAAIGAAIAYIPQVVNNIENGETGLAALVPTDGAAIVGGALAGAGLVIMAPIIVGAVSTALAGAAVTTASVATALGATSAPAAAMGL